MRAADIEDRYDSAGNQLLAHRRPSPARSQPQVNPSTSAIYDVVDGAGGFFVVSMLVDCVHEHNAL